MFGNGPVEPRKGIIYAIALLLAFALPAGIILIGDIFNTKIISEEDVKEVTDYPVIGHVFNNHNIYPGNTLMLDKPNSPASEPYRAIRTKISLIVKEKERPVIAVTSTFPNEGKTYNAINIASSMLLSATHRPAGFGS